MSSSHTASTPNVAQKHCIVICLTSGARLRVKEGESRCSKCGLFLKKINHFEVISCYRSQRLWNAQKWRNYGLNFILFFRKNVLVGIFLPLDWSCANAKLTTQGWHFLEGFSWYSNGPRSLSEHLEEPSLTMLKNTQNILKNAPTMLIILENTQNILKNAQIILYHTQKRLVSSVVCEITSCSHAITMRPPPRRRCHHIDHTADSESPSITIWIQFRNHHAL